MEHCCFDLGDCIGTRSSICPSCEVGKGEASPHLRNYFCNPDLNNIQCCFDAGDCSEDRFLCPSCGEKDLSLSWFRDSFCDHALDNPDCCYDGGDCSCPTCPLLKESSGSYSASSHGVRRYSISLGNLQCDRMLDTPECCHDGYDCKVKSRYAGTYFHESKDPIYCL